MAHSGGNEDEGRAASAKASGAAALLGQAREKLTAKDTEGALIALRAIVGLAACPPETSLDAARLLVGAGDTENAIACYVQAGTHYLRETKDLLKARQALQAAHGLDVHNLDVVFMLGQADVADGRMQDGLSKYIDVLRKSNLKHVPALFEAGCIYQTNGQHDQAMLAFKKVLDRERGHVQATVRIGQLHQSKDNLPEAISYYVQAAQIAREAQHWETARHIADTVLALDPQNQKARFILDEIEEQGHAADADVIVPEHVAAPSPQPAAPAHPASLKEPAAANSPKPAITPAPPLRSVPPPAFRPAQPVAPAPAPQAPPKPPLVAQMAAKGNVPTQASPPPVAARSVNEPPATQAPAVKRPDQPATTTGPSSPDVEHAKQALAAIELQRQAAQTDLELLLATREELQKALAEQRTILESAMMRKHELEAQAAAAQVTADEAKTTADEAQRSGQAAHDSKLQGEHEAVRSLTDERAALEKALVTLRSDADALTKQKAAEEATVADLVAARDKATHEVAALTAKMQDAKKLTDELETARAAAMPDPELVAKAQSLAQDVASLEARRSAAESATHAAEESLAALKTQIAEAQRNAAEAETLARQRDAEARTLATRVAELQADVAALRERNAATPQPTAATPLAPGARAMHARAAAHLAAREYDKAVAAYRSALEHDPKDAAAAYQAGTLLAEHGSDLEAAEKLLERAVELRPDHAATRYELAVVKARRGGVVEGSELLTMLARADANNGDFVDQFVERLEKDAQTGDFAARFRLGLAYRELGRVEEALVTLQAIQHEPEFVVPCLIAIGSCLRRQGLDGAAAKRFAKAIETPGYAEGLYLEALYNLGDLYEAKGTQESLASALSSFEELYARDCTYRDVGERVRVVRTNLGSSERQKVKRLPTRVVEGQGQ